MPVLLIVLGRVALPYMCGRLPRVLSSLWPKGTMKTAAAHQRLWLHSKEHVTFTSSSMFIRSSMFISPGEFVGRLPRNSGNVQCVGLANMKRRDFLQQLHLLAPWWFYGVRYFRSVWRYKVKRCIFISCPVTYGFMLTGIAVDLGLWPLHHLDDFIVGYIILEQPHQLVHRRIGGANGL